MNNLRCCKHRRLSRVVVDWGDFNNIGTNNVESCQAIEDSEHFTSGPTTGFGGTSGYKRVSISV